VQLGRGGQDDRVHVVAGQDLVQVGGGVRDAVGAGELLGLLLTAADQGGDGHAVDLRQPVEVLGPERAGSGERDPHERSFRESQGLRSLFLSPGQQKQRT
jgi:hypothetical protein